MSDLVAKLRDAFQRKRYGDTSGEYDPDFDLFDVAADKIEQLQTYGENMRLVCQQQAKELERLDPSRPRAEAVNR